MDYVSINTRTLDALIYDQGISPDTFLGRLQEISARRWGEIKKNCYAFREELEDLIQALNDVPLQVLLDPSEGSLELYRLAQRVAAEHGHPDPAFCEFVVRRGYEARTTHGIPPTLQDIREIYRQYRQGR